MTALAHVPFWDWPLGLLLLWVCLRALRDRRTPLVLVYLLPLLGLLTLRSVASFGVGPLVWSALALGYGLGAMIGWKRQSGRTLAKTARHVVQRGEGMTALAILTLFALNAAIGTVTAVAPDLLVSYPLPLVLSAMAGLASGTFGGRALFIASMPVTSQRSLT
ncbi:hypothetical protein [uncultured Maritimibacter sp.]|jgi:hypothetical protein|uniref:hypothetical protein n=1 Tax=uncultured Maritimibacter sp. TaxID=991866 RepID=UPI00260A6C64|nr:hypothetical protein [uncultured Maritimibacter sp.]